MTKPTTADALLELRREKAMRNRAYPRWIASGTLSQKQADVQLARLDAAIEILEEKVKGEHLL